MSNEKLPVRKDDYTVEIVNKQDTEVVRSSKVNNSQLIYRFIGLAVRSLMKLPAMLANQSRDIGRSSNVQNSGSFTVRGNSARHGGKRGKCRRRMRGR